MMNLTRQPPRLLLRPIRHDDLDALHGFAGASAHGLTTLPDDRDRLAARIERSLQSFASDDVSGDEAYLFVVEDLEAGRVVGVSGIEAQAGFGDRFCSFRNEFMVHRSQALDYANRIHTLHLCHDLTGVTLLTSFYIEPGYWDTLAPQLLSRARLLYIAQHPERFSDRIAAEHPGIADDRGSCPFWEAVGRRFFGLDYPTVEDLAGGRSKAFIADVMPTFPIYVPLLPEAAQWAIGQLHPDAELPFSILVDEGFETDAYVDIFDGGPILLSRPMLLRTIAGRRLARVDEPRQDAGANGALCLLATTGRTDFRATLAVVHASRQGVALAADARADLGVLRHDVVCLSAYAAATVEPA